MSSPAPALDRRTLLRYAIGFDLVVIAAGIALLLPPQSGLILVPFIAAVGVAASRGGWKVGVATTAFSVVALVLSFEGVVPNAQLLLFVAIGVAASALIEAASAWQRVRPVPSFAGTAALEAEEAADARRVVELYDGVRRLVVPGLMYIGLPVLVLVVNLNISTILYEYYAVPSILQPLVLIMAGLVLLLRNEFRASSAVLMPVTAAMIAYSLIVFASSSWARDIAVSDVELADLAKSVMLLLVAGSIAASWRALRGAMAALVAGAALVSVLALIQIATGDPALQFGGLAKLDEGHLYGEVNQLRPAGPIGDANYLARILLLSVPAAAFLGIGRSRRTQLVYLAATGIISAGVLVTYSRGGMLSLAAIALLLVIARRVRVTRMNVLLAAMLLLAVIPTDVGKRLLTIESILDKEADLNIIDASTDKRRQLISVAWRMFKDRPVAGVGIGNFGSYYPGYSYQAGLSGFDYTPLGVRQFPHSLYLEILAETGLLGLFAFGAAMTVTLVALQRSRQALLARGDAEHAAMVTAIAIGLIGYLLSSLFLHSGFHRHLWLFVGLGVAAVRLTKDDPSHWRPSCTTASAVFSQERTTD